MSCETTQDTYGLLLSVVLLRRPAVLLRRLPRAPTTERTRMNTNPPNFDYVVGDYGPYPARVTDEHDGDTIGLDIDIGFKHSILAFNPLSGKRQFSCRLYGINAPELSTQEGKDALAFLQTILAVGTKVVVISKDWDAYQGRYDGVIWVSPNDVSINQRMVESGHAVYKVY